jgi:glucokinase
MKNFLGIEIGGTKLQIVSGNEHGEIVQRFRFLVDVSAGAEGIRKHISDTIKGLPSANFSAIGVGFGGPVDRVSGRVWTSYHVGGWSGFELKKWLEDISGVNVTVDNDANVAALGEACIGAGRGQSIVFYVTLGSGVGGGLVIDKKIYHGALPGETELGHVRLDKTGNTVQSLCSGWAVNAKILAAAGQYPETPLALLARQHPGAEAKALTEAMQAHDKMAIKIFEETCDDLALGLSHAVHLFHPHMIVLGGGLSLMGEPLRISVQQNLTRYVMDAFQPGPVFSLSQLKEDAVPAGALILAANNN